MRTTSQLFIAVFTLLALAASAYAQTSREQLNQMVQQLQKTPNDNALREKIIKLAATIKPAPAIPEEAQRRMVRGAAAFKSATSAAGYQDAAKEFEQATQAAPWYGDAYFNLGVSQDKAGNYEAALRSLKFAQLTSPDSKEIKTLMYEVEFRQEKANSPEARAAKQKFKDDDLIKSLEGAVFSHSFSNVESEYRISNGRAVEWNRRIAFRGPLCGSGAHMSGPIGEQMTCPDFRAIRLVGRRGERSHHFGIDSDVLARHTPCNPKERADIVGALAEAHVELVLIHPFREGNGRMARVLSTLMALQAGLPLLDFGLIAGERKETYFTAVQAGLDKNYKPMEQLFAEIIERSLAAS
jgi:cell filamentation protein